MRGDLQEARECVAWTVSHFPFLKERHDAWLKSNVKVEIRDDNPNATHCPIVAVEKEALPLSFNVEVGAYINVLRTSLDILATALARRHGVIDLESVYFPIIKTRSQFLSGKYKGHELVKILPAIERGILENLKPYQGGNNILWAIHALDIKRKHQRLLKVEAHPSQLSITAVGLKEDDFAPIRTEGGWIRNNNETILGLLRRGMPRPKMEFSTFIGFDEPETGMSHIVLEALDQFARLTNSIISLFDDP